MIAKLVAKLRYRILGPLYTFELARLEALWLGAEARCRTAVGRADAAEREWSDWKHVALRNRATIEQLHAGAAKVRERIEKTEQLCIALADEVEFQQECSNYDPISYRVPGDWEARVAEMRKRHEAKS